MGKSLSSFIIILSFLLLPGVSPLFAEQDRGTAPGLSRTRAGYSDREINFFEAAEGEEREEREENREDIPRGQALPCLQDCSDPVMTALSSHISVPHRYLNLPSRAFHLRAPPLFS